MRPMTIKVLFLISTCFIMFLLTMSANVFARTLDPPTPLEVELLYRYLAGDPPNYEERALQTPEYRNANEFEKPQALKRIITNLQRQYNSIQDVDTFKVHLRSQFSQYDPGKEVYYLEAFKPNAGYLSFTPYALDFENSDRFREWHLGVAEAKQVLERSPYRGVALTVILRPLGPSPSRQNTLRVQITKVEIHNDQSLLLGTLSIPASEIRSAKRIETEQKVARVEKSRLEVQGLSLGVDPKAAEEWAKTRGFTTKVIQEQAKEVRDLRFSTSSEALDYKPKSVNAHDLIMGGSLAVRNDDPGDFFGKKLNCRGTLSKTESCGELKFDKVEGIVQLISITLVQSAEGITKQQLVSTLMEKFGEPRDRLKATLLGFIEGEHFVWGTSSVEKNSPIRQLTNLPSGQHWQIEAVIAQPEANKISVVMQINEIKAVESATGAGGGRIQF